MTLTETLLSLGLTHVPATGKGLYAHDIANRLGAIVFTGTAGEVWEWLRLGS